MTHFDRQWFTSSILPSLVESLRSKRWFAAKTKKIREVTLLDYGHISDDGNFFLPIIKFEYSDGKDEIYFYPLYQSSEPGHE